MKLDLIQHVGAGTIRFGMTQEIVRKTLGVPFRTFKKSPTSEYPTDVFQSEIFVYYKHPGVCEAIEVAPQSDLIWEGRSLVGTKCNELLKHMRAADPKIDVDGAGAISYAFGFGFYTSSLKDMDTAVVEAAIAFEKGYYDR